MATAKKVVKKKSVAPKTAKSTTKTAAKKKSVNKRQPSVHSKNISTSSSTSTFWQVKFTINTVYWIVIGIAVISTAIIAYNTNMQVNDLYDSIDAQNARLEELDI